MLHLAKDVWYKMNARGDVWIACKEDPIGRMTGPFGKSDSFSMVCKLHQKCRLPQTVRQLEGDSSRLVLWLLAGREVSTAEEHACLWAPSLWE